MTLVEQPDYKKRENDKGAKAEPPPEREFPALTPAIFIPPWQTEIT
jgi:hypothetical protein